jgi:hypothetical protein
MVKMLSAGILAALVWIVQPAAAQAPVDKDDVKKLEKEVEQLKKRLQDTEALLKKVKGEAAKKDDKPEKPFRRRGGFDPDQLKQLRDRLGGKDGPLANLDVDQIKKMLEMAEKMREQGEKMREQFGKDFPFGKIDPEQLKKLRDLRGKPKAEEKKLEEKKPAEDIEKKLERLLKEVEELRKEIKKK